MKQIEFIEKSKIVFGDIFDFSMLDYKNNKINIKIICKKCGDIFEQSPANFLKGKGCPNCRIKKNLEINSEKLFDFLLLKFNNKYDYSLVNYINSKTKVKIICPIHGQFEQSPINLIRGMGCPKCSFKKKWEDQKLTKETFIAKSNKTHNNKYDYSLVDYTGCRGKVKIICPVHGEFLQIPYYHLAGNGCSICKESQGEKEVSKILTEMSMEFEREKTFKDCRNVRTLPFDFYLHSLNIAIEYNGPQHYKIIERWKGKEGLFYRQNNDKIKSDYCLANNIKLITIKYDEDIKAKLMESGVIK